MRTKDCERGSAGRIYIARRTGQTLIEVMIATVVTAMTATAVFSVVLSARMNSSRSDKKEAAIMAVKAAQEQLKIYVSAVPREKAFSPTATEGELPANPWSGGGKWPLAGGVTHDISSLLEGVSLLAGDPAPTLTYTVVNQDCGFGTEDAVACKQVTFKLEYPD